MKPLTDRHQTARRILATYHSLVSALRSASSEQELRAITTTALAELVKIAGALDSDSDKEFEG